MDRTGYPMDSNRDLLDNSRQNQALGESLAASIRYVPLLTALLALGLTIIYAFARSGLLSAATWQLLAVAGLSLGAGLLHFGVSALAVRGRTVLAFGLLLVILALWAFGIVFLWEAAWPVAILIAWIAFLAGLSMRFPRSWLGGVALASGLVTLVILWFDANPPFERVAVTNQAALASLLLLASTVLLAIVAFSLHSRLLPPDFFALLAYRVIITYNLQQLFRPGIKLIRVGSYLFTDESAR